MIDANLDCGPTTLEFDMLQELQEALAAQRNHYTHSPGFAFAETPGQAQRLRIEGREEECVVGRTRITVKCENVKKVVRLCTTEVEGSGQNVSNSKKR